MDNLNCHQNTLHQQKLHILQYFLQLNHKHLQEDQQLIQN
uniref:Uncharacterized protein n=1 Tax=Myoviridae sp. ctjhW4 TaxID=2825162 RepID=A0A8S5PS94_9CAUD|nr:MAG TPA: hypothetical protein [Myoviridae sp. ctjhW4]